MGNNGIDTLDGNAQETSLRRLTARVHPAKLAKLCGPRRSTAGPGSAGVFHDPSLYGDPLDDAAGSVRHSYAPAQFREKKLGLPQFPCGQPYELFSLFQSPENVRSRQIARSEVFLSQSRNSRKSLKTKWRRCMGIEPTEPTFR